MLQYPSSGRLQSLRSIAALGADVRRCDTRGATMRVRRVDRLWSHEDNWLP
jgi:hypothetical protein